MTPNSISSFIWNENYWFPSNRSWGWKDLVNKPGSDIYYPDINHLYWVWPLAVVLLVCRYVFEMLVVVPLAVRMGVKNKKKPTIIANHVLEKVYKKHKHPDHDTVQSLSKQTDMTTRQIEVWFRDRRKQDMPTPIQKFRECSYHLIFYTALFVHGMVTLWKDDSLLYVLILLMVIENVRYSIYIYLLYPKKEKKKDYFWDPIKCWDGWPKQHVSNDVFWYYMMELGFYWSLVFSLCSDHRRKDFKEMIIHHVATIVLMTFSWVCNFVRVGTLVLAVHDAADTWLALAKMSIYMKRKLATDIFFGIFLLVWVISRLIVFPFVCLKTTTIYPFTSNLIDATFGAHQFFNFFLYILQVLHLIWTYLIFRIVIKKLVGQGINDVRSDTEEDSDVVDNDLDTTVTMTMNGDVVKGTAESNGISHKEGLNGYTTRQTADYRETGGAGDN